MNLYGPDILLQVYAYTVPMWILVPAVPTLTDAGGGVHVHRWSKQIDM